MEEKEKILDEDMTPVQDPVVVFKMTEDRIVRQVINSEINEPLVEISGYDLQINFNMKYLKSVADIDAACNGIADLFRQEIMSALLDGQKQND